MKNYELLITNYECGLDHVCGYGRVKGFYEKKYEKNNTN